MSKRPKSWSMTLRELLKSLQAVDDELLDKEVVVSLRSGSYTPISHVSTLYAGHPVIHLVESKPTQQPGPDLWPGTLESDFVAAVNPADLQNAWKAHRNTKANGRDGRSSFPDTKGFQAVCTPRADIEAVWFRASMLDMMMQMMPDLLAPWTHDGQLADAVFQVASAFPMKKMRIGVVEEGPLFDVLEFAKQIGARQ